MEVTDMILDIAQLVTADDLPTVTLHLETPAIRAALRDFVAAEHPPFSRYYASPPAGTDMYAVMAGERLVGAVLLEQAPRSADLPTDGALACLVIAARLRGQRLGSAAIVTCCQRLGAQGCRRVIAEWVWSVALYSRLGFRIWKTRQVVPA